jgi:hypothetical protein
VILGAELPRAARSALTGTANLQRGSRLSMLKRLFRSRSIME